MRIKLKISCRTSTKKNCCRNVIICASIGLHVMLLMRQKEHVKTISKTMFSNILEFGMEGTRKLQLPINKNSTLKSDIRTIWHFPSEQSICIEQQNNTRCPHPAFLGRLSGQSLAMLDWGSQNNEKFGRWMRCGSYDNQWISSGTYFLELIVLFCEDFGVNSLKRFQNESEWLSIDFQHTCLEDPNYNRITGSDSYIVIDPIEESPASRNAPRGRWVLPTIADSMPKPLHYRYQPQGCRKNPKQAICENSTNGTALAAYSFEWEKNVGERWRDRIQSAKNGSRAFSTVCFVGFSHSRILSESFVRLGIPKKYAIWVKAKFPEDITPALLNQSYTENGCTTFIIAAAQWPGSRIGRFPYLFDRFYSEMKRIVETAFGVFAGREDVRVYMRSIHEIPIGDFTGSCPIIDWRSPVVMNGYSYLVEKAVREIRAKDTGSNLVSYLDTSFLVSAMWDSAYDWVHLPFQVSDEEALYMSSVVSER